MKKILSMLMVLIMLCTLASLPTITACAEESGESSPQEQETTISEPSGQENTGGGTEGGNTEGGNTEGGNTEGGNTGGGNTEGGGTEGGNTEGGGTEGGGTEGGGTEGGGTEGGGTEGGGTGGGNTEGGGTGGGNTEGGGTEGGGTEGGGTGGGNTNPPINQPQAPAAISGKPVITKHPGDESVNSGSSAEFIAHAYSYNTLTWHLVSPDGTTIAAQDAPSHFPGLGVSGVKTEHLVLNNIPKELHGWQVRAEFFGQEESVLSNGAVITIRNLPLSAPTITQHPQSASPADNETATLHVAASSNHPNAKLLYQWYRNTVDSNSGGSPILGATEASYTPKILNGTTYYYCAVRAAVGNEVTNPIASQCAAVVYGAAQTAPAVTEAPSTPVPDTTEVTEATVNTEASRPTENTVIPNQTTAPRRSNGLLIIAGATIAVIAVLGAVATLLILKLYPKESASEKEDDFSANNGEFDYYYGDNSEFADTYTGDDTWDDLSDLGDLSEFLKDD